jgi:surface antigen
VLVLALLPNLRSSRPLYSGTGSPSLCRLFSRIGLHAAAATLALTAAGCSFSYQLDSLSEKSKQPTTAEATGSVRDKSAATAAKPRQPTDRDLAYARAAASEVLRRGGDGASQPWENPETGARGTVTPIASAYSMDGFTCQDFLASYIRAGSNEDWMRGEACRIHKGNWEVRSLKPWKSS